MCSTWYDESTFVSFFPFNIEIRVRRSNTLGKAKATANSNESQWQFKKPVAENNLNASLRLLKRVQLDVASNLRNKRELKMQLYCQCQRPVWNWMDIVSFSLQMENGWKWLINWSYYIVSVVFSITGIFDIHSAIQLMEHGKFKDSSRSQKPAIGVWGSNHHNLRYSRQLTQIECSPPKTKHSTILLFPYWDAIEWHQHWQHGFTVKWIAMEFNASNAPATRSMWMENYNWIVLYAGALCNCHTNELQKMRLQFVAHIKIVSKSARVKSTSYTRSRGGRCGCECDWVAFTLCLQSMSKLDLHSTKFDDILYMDIICKAVKCTGIVQKYGIGMGFF